MLARLKAENERQMLKDACRGAGVIERAHVLKEASRSREHTKREESQRREDDLMLQEKSRMTLVSIETLTATDPRSLLPQVARDTVCHAAIRASREGDYASVLDMTDGNVRDAVQQAKRARDDATGFHTHIGQEPRCKSNEHPLYRTSSKDFGAQFRSKRKAPLFPVERRHNVNLHFSSELSGNKAMPKDWFADHGLHTRFDKSRVHRDLDERL